MAELEPRLGIDTAETLRRRALRLLGLDRESRISIDAQETLKGAVDAILDGAHPRGAYQELPLLGVEEDRVLTDAGPIESSFFAELARRAQGERTLVFTAATIGGSVDGLLGFDLSLFKRSVLDVVASELTEMVADAVDDDWMVQARREGRQFARRFSPGYCDWPMEGLRVVFEALRGQDAGVTLDSNRAMSPSKSVSGVTLIARSIPLKDACALCDKAMCSWRRAPAGNA